MRVNIVIFGQLCELVGENIVLDDITDTDHLTAVLHQKFPGLVDSKYRMAVNKKLVNEKTTLTDNSTVALLPPFSGG